MKKMLVTLFLVGVIMCFVFDVANAEIVIVDVRNYITQSTPGFHLCQENSELCIDGRWVLGPSSGDEFFYTSSNSGKVTDYYARDSNSPYFIGVIRSKTASDSRCFANPGQTCAAPSTTDHPPQAIPMIFAANRIDYQPYSYPDNMYGYEFSDGSPRTTIPGAVAFTDWQLFDILTIDSSCNQERIGPVYSLILVVVARAINFGGNIGTQYDVLIQDELQCGYPNWMDCHMERFYYVPGLGRVREGSSWYNNQTGVYDLVDYTKTPPRFPLNSNRNIIMPGDMDWSNGVLCYQGGAPWQ